MNMCAKLSFNGFCEEYFRFFSLSLTLSVIGTQISQRTTQETFFNKQIQRIYVPRQDFFLRNKESSENVKFIRGVTLTRYILSTYVDSNNA